MRAFVRGCWFGVVRFIWNDIKRLSAAAEEVAHCCSATMIVYGLIKARNSFSLNAMPSLIFLCIRSFWDCAEQLTVMFIHEGRQPDMVTILVGLFFIEGRSPN